MSTFDVETHRETWLGFARLMRWTVATIVVVLSLLAYFLV
ncbi:MAG TPA: aa3-type cytochrome c oxidase subunit IV [Stellaceae bacterium]|nr:aa3-type cytochrome c oxidase subunit IV [Stellaceae bacterium]